MTGLRIGVVGIGRIGVMHARNAAQTSGVREVVLIGRDPARTAVAAEEVRAALAPGAPESLAGALAPRDSDPAPIVVSTRTFGDALAGLDGVIIATSTASHPELTLRAAEAGIPVLVEKPLALDLAVLEETCDRIEQIGTPVMVAFHRRFDPAHRALRDHVRGGDVGALRVVSATDHDHLRLSPDYIPLSGGIWRDLMIHDFDIIPWVTGDRVRAVQAFGSVLDAPVHATHGDVDTALAVLQLASGAIAAVTGTRRNDAGQDVRLEIFGSAGTFGTGLDSRTPVTSTEPGGVAPAAPYQQFIDRFEPAFRRELDAFVTVIGGGRNDSPPRAGVDALRVALAAAESVESGRLIPLSPDDRENTP